MTETVTLRPLRVTDAAEMAVVLAHPDLYRYTDGEPPSEADLERLYAIQTRERSADGTEEWLNDNVVVGDDQRAADFVQATQMPSQTSDDGRVVVLGDLGDELLGPLLLGDHPCEFPPTMHPATPSARGRSGDCVRQLLPPSED